ncbi:MAG: cupin domain-containing protein [Algicola sp.]|nr:cupin domain-containing protein [Algicola sp.]
MIRNFLSCEKQSDKNSHGGVGTIDVQKVFRRKDFKGAWDFALRVVMPPNTSMGIHEHGQNEEMYIILSGEGLMTIEDKQHRVGKGDMILNSPGGSHGLFNDSEAEIELLIVQASLPT